MPPLAARYRRLRRQVFSCASSAARQELGERSPQSPSMRRATCYKAAPMQVTASTSPSSAPQILRWIPSSTFEDVAAVRRVYAGLAGLTWWKNAVWRGPDALETRRRAVGAYAAKGRAKFARRGYCSLPTRFSWRADRDELACAYYAKEGVRGGVVVTAEVMGGSHSKSRWRAWGRGS